MSSAAGDSGTSTVNQAFEGVASGREHPAEPEAQSGTALKDIQDELTSWLEERRYILSDRFWEDNRLELQTLRIIIPSLSPIHDTELFAGIGEVWDMWGSLVYHSENPGEWSIETRRFHYCVNSFDFVFPKDFTHLLDFATTYIDVGDQGLRPPSSDQRGRKGAILSMRQKMYGEWCAVLQAAVVATRARKYGRETYGLTIREDLAAACKAASYGLSGFATLARERLSANSDHPDIERYMPGP